MKVLSNEKISVFAPATIGNLGLGFDILGLALSGAGDTVTVKQIPENKVIISKITGDNNKLSKNVNENTAGIAAIETLKKTGISIGLEIELKKGLPIGSGMGSSAASAVASAFAVNRLLGSPLRKFELIEPCLKAEEEVSDKCVDNIAPSLLGGFILVRSIESLDIIRLPIPEGLAVAVITPNIEITTKKAREIIPKSVSLKDLIHNTANLAALISACHSGNLGLMSRCAPDKVITPARASLIPGCEKVINTALDSGAIISSISGSGPAIFAFFRSLNNATNSAEKMVLEFKKHGLESNVLISPANCPGAKKV